jgi:hypothetical protein
MPMDCPVPKGPAGFGMNISAACQVTSFSGGDSAGKNAGVPLKSTIVRHSHLIRFFRVSS